MPRLEDVRVGDPLPGQQRETSVVQQFLYNAVLWNAHRIHYDEAWATEVEGYPGLLVAGPLMGDWLAQCALAWLDGGGRLVSVEYSNRRAAYIGERLHVGGRISGLDRATGRVPLELAVSNAEGETVVPGIATVELEGP